MKIHIPEKVFKKIRAYTRGTDYEISGLGKVSFFDNIFTIEDVKIFEQKVTGSETTLDRVALGKFYDQIVQEEGDLSKWKLWWHSHAEMSTFFSGTDESTIEDFNNETERENWILAIVTNRKGDFRMRLDVFSPLRITLDNLDYEVVFQPDETSKEIAKEIKDKVKEPVKFFGNLFNDDEDEEEKKKEMKKNREEKRKKRRRPDPPDDLPPPEAGGNWLWNMFAGFFLSPGEPAPNSRYG